METKVMTTREDAVVVTALNRPEVYNALDQEMVKPQPKSGRTLDTPLESQLENQRLSISACVAPLDTQEGIQAFWEKRKPVFRRH